MPRTFSRGSPFTADKMIEFFTHMPDLEADAYVKHIRFRFCPSPGLEEQFLDDLLDFLRNLFGNIRRFADHLSEFHADIPHLGGNLNVIETLHLQTVLFTEQRIETISTEDDEAIV